MMNRKQVAILLPWLKMGGTNKVALRFVKELSIYCDVTLILSQNTGELFHEVPEGVRIIIDNMKDFRSIFFEDLKKIRFRKIMKDLRYYYRVKSNKDNIDNYRYLVGRNDLICEDEFDCAISYHGQSPERLLNLLYRIKAKKKVAWIHGEMSFPPDHMDRMKKYYDQLDHFFFVSVPTMKSFQNIIGVEDSICTVYYNPLDKKEIEQMSEMPMEIQFDKAYINLLTVGRLSAEKGQEMIPPIMERLLNEGYQVRWYIIGDGPTRPQLEALIREYHVQDNVLLLGVQTNPYNYMKACDIYIQPSYTEGYSTTICEAAILGKAIIGTKPSGGIRDQIEDGVSGLIVDATEDGLTDGIIHLIRDVSYRYKLEKEIQKKDFEGRGEIRKFINYLG